VAMLTLIVNMRPRSRQLQLIAQELATDLCEFSFVPIVTKHLPGVANKVADELARRHQPGAVAKHMQFLSQAEEIKVPKRDAKYYVTLDCAPEQYG
jgi:hypothetical protein